jgi:hypothetical protein
VRGHYQYILFAVLVAGALAALVLANRRHPEPTYLGRSANEWLDDCAREAKTDHRKAIESMGTNALPYIVRRLRHDDLKSWQVYWNLRAKLPMPLQDITPRPELALDVMDGTDAIAAVGAPAVPCAIALLRDESSTVRQVAAQALGDIARGTSSASAASSGLCEALSDQDVLVRGHAVIALGCLGPGASNAVPALTQLLGAPGNAAQNKHERLLQCGAAWALGQIGPGARSALPLLKANLQNADVHLAGTSALAIWEIDADVDTAMPVLLRELPQSEDDRDLDAWAEAIGQMGPKATWAYPRLAQIARERNKPWLWDYVTNATKDLHPETAEKVTARSHN